MHPYQDAPDRSFWSRSVSKAFDPATIVDRSEPLLVPGDVIASAGSCFAANIVPHLQSAGFGYLRTEPRASALLDGIPPENLSYDKFTAAYGNIYTPRQMLQLLRRSFGRFQPIEDRWPTEDGVLDPYRPGLRYHALNEREFNVLSARHLAAVRRMFEECTVFIFTLGLTEAWVHRQDGAVFPACPGTVAGSFDATRHAFVNFSVIEIMEDLSSFITEFRAVNPSVRLVLTVSPVPLVATATGRHVLAASTYSKSVLRVAADEVVARHGAFTTYFPAYEIVTGPQAPDHYMEADRRNVSQQGIGAVMGAFLACCAGASGRLPSVAPPNRSDGSAVDRNLSSLLSEAECEEAMSDAKGNRPGS